MEINFFSGSTGQYYSQRTGPVGYAASDLAKIQVTINEKIAALQAEGRVNIRGEIGINFPFQGCALQEEGATLEVFLPDRASGGDKIRHRLYNAVGENVTGLTCWDCGREFVPEKLPPEGFVGLFQSFFRCPDHNRGYSGEFECPPESPMDRRKLRRRIEDALRKSASDADLVYIADRLNVRI